MKLYGVYNGDENRNKKIWQTETAEDISSIIRMKLPPSVTLFQQNCLSSQNRQICSPGSCSNVNVLTCKCLWNKDEQFILIYIYFKYMDVLPVYVPGPCVWCPPRPEEGTGVPETRVTDSGESLAYWELNMGLLRSSQCLLFTAEPPLQPPVIYSF